MTVRVVTDSVSDISPAIAAALDIAVVPLQVVIGSRTYLDGVDLTTDEFYAGLESLPALPTISPPPPEAFADGYERLAVEDATTPEETGVLVDRLGIIFLQERFYRAKVSPVIGANVGPRVIGVAVLGDR